MVNIVRGFITAHSDLADNDPYHPGLQDLDIWTKDQMRSWISDHISDDFITGSSPDDDENRHTHRTDDEEDENPW